MNVLLPNLIEALREELKQYGEMLARLDHQQNVVMRRQSEDILPSVAAINRQADIIAATRAEREQCQRQVAHQLNLPESAAFAAIVPLLPADYRPLVQALVQENNELLVRVQQRARQNQLLLRRSLDLMQNLLQTLFPVPQRGLYDGGGHSRRRSLPSCALYDAAG